MYFMSQYIWSGNGSTIPMGRLETKFLQFVEILKSLPRNMRNSRDASDMVDGNIYLLVDVTHLVLGKAVSYHSNIRSNNLSVNLLFRKWATCIE